MGRKLTQEEFEQKVQEKYNGKYSVEGRYIKSTEKIMLKCNQCGAKFTRVPAEVIETKGHTCCPVCDKNLITRNGVIRGVNDLWTTNPDVALLLKNQEDGHVYSNGSNVRALFVCPTCGNERLKTIAEVVRYGWFCDACSDGNYYPNKFMSNLLMLNGIDYKNEFIIPGFQYRYDFYFMVNNQHYLVEMDGGLNHGCVDLRNLSIEEQIENDSKKDLLADKFGYNLIRIDCKYPDLKHRFEYIKSNILKTDLKFLLSDLSEDIFIKCDTRASNTNLVVEIANAWNDGVHSLDELSKLFNICKGTVRNRINNAIKVGLISESRDVVSHEIHKAGVAKRSYTTGSRIMCNETGEVFASIADAIRNGHTTVGRYLNQKINYAGKLSNGTKLTWRKIANEEYEGMTTSL